jgi:hypothetical protein
MTDPKYKRLVKHLTKTRKPLWQACKELDISMDDIDDTVLTSLIVNCSHCDIWGTNHVPDLDDNPICVTCLQITGM